MPVAAPTQDHPPKVAKGLLMIRRAVSARSGRATAHSETGPYRQQRYRYHQLTPPLASRTAVPFDFPPCLPKPPTGSFVVKRDSARRKRVSMDDGGGSGLILEMSSTRALSNSAFAPLSG